MRRLRLRLPRSAQSWLAAGPRFCLCLALALCACKVSPEAARKKLEGDGIAFTPAEFVKRAATDPWPTLELFLRAGMDPNIKGDTEKLEGVTALMVASRAGRDDVARRLHEAGADVNKETRQGDTALIHAASGGFPAVVRYLLLSGADVHHANRRGETALLLAIPAPWPQQDEARAVDCVNQLLVAGAKVNQRSPDGSTVLHAAIGRAQLLIVRLLLLRGADPNLKGGQQNASPLMHAIRADQPQIVEALLRSGADPKEPGLLESVNDGLRTNGPAMREALRKGGVGGAAAVAN
jgi:hypothetical protein